MKKSEIIILVMFILSIIFLASSILCGVFDAFLSWTTHLLSIALSAIITVVSIIICIVTHKETSVTKITLMVLTIIITLITAIATYKPFAMFHSYSEVTKKLSKDKNIPAFRIKGISNRKDENCEYIYDVITYDGNNTVFQAGYCECGTMWTSYCVKNNYNSTWY